MGIIVRKLASHTHTHTTPCACVCLRVPHKRSYTYLPQGERTQSHNFGPAASTGRTFAQALNWSPSAVEVHSFCTRALRTRCSTLDVRRLLLHRRACCSLLAAWGFARQLSRYVAANYEREFDIVLYFASFLCIFLHSTFVLLFFLLMCFC